MLRKYDKLKAGIGRMGSVIVAFSGGADSTLLLKAAIDSLGKKNVLAVTAVSETYPSGELDAAKRTAKKLGVSHIIIKSGELNIQEFRNNTPVRCYYCKKELYSKLLEIAKKQKIRFVLDASNYDDLKDYRPGANAIKEFGIKSPLQEVKLAKNEIRKISKSLKLETWNKPSMACLASRIPYGDKIIVKKLRAIENAENFLHKLGIKQARVRHHGSIARIEMSPEDFSITIKNHKKIADYLTKQGFTYVTLDLEGYTTGSMNKTLTNRTRKSK